MPRHPVIVLTLGSTLQAMGVRIEPNESGA